MKRRDLLFLISSILIGLAAWAFLSGFLDVAQAVGDAPIEFNPSLRALKLTLILIGIYAVLYYLGAIFNLINWIVLAVKRKAAKRKT